MQDCLTVAQLIEQLRKMPQWAPVLAPYDGGVAQVEIGVVWQSRGGAVMLAAIDEPIYEDEDRPLDAPSREQNRYWRPRDGWPSGR